MKFVKEKIRNFLKMFKEDEVNIQIQTTSICNGKCIICPYVGSWYDSNPGVMSDEVFDKVLEEIKPLKIDKFCPYLMNEPLADPKIFERLEKIKELKNFNYIEFATNGILLNEERAEKLIDALKDIEHKVCISFHGTNKENYNEIMKLDFDKSIHNICNFLVKADGKLKIWVRGGGMPLKNGAPTWFSEKEYKDFWEKKFESLNLKKPPKIDFFTYIDRADNLTDKRLSANFRRKSMKGFKCDRIGGWLHFNYEGDMIICCMDYHKEEVLGNITKNTLNEIKNSSRMKEVFGKAKGEIESSDNFICKRCLFR
ncbi:MAG: radical SAM/SPASM domain-containing protein [archaeon]